ncbi:tandem-95 repeat protein [Curtobacterium sp. 458]|uniref:Ig-like domain-containing protein n=1 Tax=Curtobacterium sp. 458 TaxID=3050069 RepID=UPI0025B578A2|nr:tandem-95 repeat protein [Curtobacterium sp. 458]WJY01273.1 tandem-95 repeat protein [Curtobacterium sp. 458]
MSAKHRAHFPSISRKLLAGVTAAALVATGAILVDAAGAMAAEPFAASDMLATQRQADGTGSPNIVRIDPSSGTATTALTAPSGNSVLNQIGISGDGRKVYATDPNKVYIYDTDTDQWSTVDRPTTNKVTTTMGGVDPKSQRFYFGGQTTGEQVFRFRSYDPATGALGANQLVVSTPTNAPGGNGDLAFDRQGNMYFISSAKQADDGTNLAQLYRVDAADLTQSTADAVTVGPPIEDTPTLNSLAFGADGYLYVAGGGTNGFLKVNPVTGDILSRSTVMQSGSSVALTDLGSRAVPSTGSATGGFTGGKAKPSDQLTISVGGGDVPKPATATTSDGNDSVTAGPIILLPGSSYTVTQSPGNGSTDPNDYDTSYVCTDLVSKAIVSQGAGTTAPFTVPATGGDVSCAFSNPLKPKVVNSSSTANAPGKPATVDVLQGSQGDIDPTTVQLTDAGVPGSVVSDGGKTLTVPGQGVWTVDPKTGVVTFTPEDGFTKNPSPVTYTVQDTRRNTTQGQVAVTYRGAAQNDAATTDQGKPVSVDVLRNDQGGVVATSVVFPTAGQPDGATVADGGRTLIVPGQGSYSADPSTGAVTFTPEPTFRGTTTPVTYRVADADGGTSTAQVTISVTPVGPKAAAETVSTQQNTPVTVDVAGDAKPGVNGGNPIDPTSVVFTAAGQPDGATVSDGGKQLTVPAEGIYSIDPATGKVTFTPAPGYAGTTTPVTYQVGDTGGATGTGTIVVTVTPVSPTANPDTATTTQGESISTDVLGDDTAGNAETPLDPATEAFPTAGQPAGATVSGNGQQLAVPGQGAYTIDPATGKITFAPEPTFRGTASPATYRVADVDGTRTSSTLTVTVSAVGPVAQADTARTGQNTPVSVPVIGNDRPGVERGTPIDPTSVVFPTSSQPQGAVVSVDGRTLTVPGQGAYVADPTSGAVVFTPMQGWSGTTAPVTYQVGDTGGRTATATITVTVVAALPTATADTARTPQDTPVTVSVLGNDRAGNDRTPIVRGSVRLLGADGRPVTTLAVPGKGTFTVDTTTGEVTFAPAKGWTGTLEAPYQIADADGGTASSTVTVTVGAAPRAVDDVRTGTPGKPITVSVTGNDGAGSSPVDPTSVRLVDPETGALVTSVTVPGKGTFTVGNDGAITFTPVEGFHGRAEVSYSVAGEDGSRATATLTITYPAVAAGTVRPTADGGRLAFTGTDVAWQGSIAALLLLVAGGTTLVLRRRKRAGSR